MPSFFKASAFVALALSALASAQTSATLPVPNPLVPTTNITSPSVAVPGTVYIGCESSFSSFKNFTLVETTTAMTVERCLLDCSNYVYAGVNGPACYCSNSLGDAKTVPDALCKTPCPGKATETCGGKITISRKRQIIGGILLSTYQRLSVVPVGVVYTTVITNVYVNINLNVGTYVTATYSSIVTVTGCGCLNPVLPTIPVITTTLLCSVCANGSPAIVTVTVPAAVTPGISTVTVVAPKPSLFTGAAPNLGVGAGSIGGLVAVVGAGMALL